MNRTLAYPIQHCMAIDHICSKIQKLLIRENDSLIFFPTAWIFCGRKHLRNESTQANRFKQTTMEGKLGPGAGGLSACLALF